MSLKDLHSAIETICRVHTTTREDVGFQIEVGATWGPEHGPMELYTEAWETLRAAVDLPVSPDD